jgi:hypothetical protein
MRGGLGIALTMRSHSAIGSKARAAAEGASMPSHCSTLKTV